MVINYTDDVLIIPLVPKI